VTIDAVTGALIAGYPVLGSVIVVLWKAYQKSNAETRRINQEMLAEKNKRINELEAFKDHVEKKLGGKKDGA
jgi:hypothetical protein